MADILTGITDFAKGTFSKISEGVVNAPAAIKKAADEALWPHDWTDWSKPFAPRHSKFGESNTAYSGCDITPTIFTGRTLMVLGNIHTLSYSIHREKGFVRTLTRMYPKGVVRGPATIAGSLIFSVFDRHVLYDLLSEYEYEPSVDQNPETDGSNMRSPLSVQIPPFDISIAFTNEYGYLSFLKIYGVEIVDEGQTMSVDDIVTENMMQFTARDIDPMMPYESGERSGRSIMFNKATFTERTPLIRYNHELYRQVGAYQNAIRYVQNLINENHNMWIYYEGETMGQDYKTNRDTLKTDLLKLQNGGNISSYTKQKLVEKGYWNGLKKQDGKPDAVIGLTSAEESYNNGIESDVSDMYQRNGTVETNKPMVL